MKERNPLQTVLRFIEENINQKGIFFRDSSHKRVMNMTNFPRSYLRTVFRIVIVVIWRIESFRERPRADNKIH